MAELLFNKLSKKNSAKSAGIGKNPRSPGADKGVRGTMKVMGELGIRMKYKLGRPVTRKDVERSDKIVVLLDEKQLHILPKYVTNSPKTVYYGITDSDARSKDFLEQHRRNRDLIKKLVLKLVAELG